MKKEEFPTFLNEQPTIIFGRTGRELLLIAGGAMGAFTIWTSLEEFRTTPAGMVATIALVALTIIASLVIALFSVAGRPLEEWIFVLLFYALMPKLYLNMPDEEIVYLDDAATQEKEQKQQEMQHQIDPFDEEDES